MKVVEAQQMIASATIFSETPSTWADLGCGSGVFTRALANQLSANSKIIAIDSEKQTFPENIGNDVQTDFMLANFEQENLLSPVLDGIMMANSLHYIKEKEEFLKKSQSYFKQKGRYLIIEYDTMKGNPWVPFPIDFQHLKTLFLNLGFEKVSRLGERTSKYGLGNLYAAQVY